MITVLGYQSHKKSLLLFVFFLALLLASSAFSQKVIAIADGDTFTILQNNKQIKIRIDAIDAPEKGMPYNKVAKKYFSDLCFAKIVTIKAVKIDRYGRTVARITLPNGKDISTEMIKAGMAWHYKKYSKDLRLAKLETEARTQKRGLWKYPNPIAPWEIRKLHRKGISTKKRFEHSVK